MKRCPSCSLANTSDAAFCIRCGFPLSGVTADATDPRAPADVAQSRPGYLSEGTLVDRKYQIERVIGEGGMGVVYLARDIHTETPVVVKAIRMEFADNPEFRARTLAEGRALARIDHPNVVRLNAVVVEPSSLYLVMQFIDGEPLDQMIERHVAERRPIPLAQVLSIFRMILHGVGAAHAEGLIHRDLKPANVLIRKKDGVAKVTDFGIAKGEDDAKAGRGLTKGIIGSLSYMAPEQVLGQRDLDKRVDIYALGIVLFELLMGRVPFEAPSDYELMRMHAEAPMPSVSERRPDVPRALDAAVQRACAKDRGSRFGSTEEFLAALDSAEPREPLRESNVPSPHQRAGGGHTEIVQIPNPFDVAPRTVSAHTTSGGASLPSGPPPKARPRKPFVAWAGGLTVAIGLAGATVYFMSGDSPAQPTVAKASRDVAEHPADAASLPVAHPAASLPEARPAVSPLASLVGSWKSSSKRDFTAVKIDDDTLEFHIADASQHPRQGYQDGDVRFKLTVIPGGAKGEFAVEDDLRPTPPAGVEYDPATSRESCVVAFGNVKGKKLLAQFDGVSSLTVDLVQIRTGAEKFAIKGKRVAGCVDLAEAPAEPIESKLTRVP